MPLYDTIAPTVTNPMNTTTPSSTLYPKIFSDIRPFLRSLERHHRRNNNDASRTTTTTTLHMTGTVKLHGTHADMRVDLSTGTVTPQSRNNAALTPAKDNMDFARFCLAQQPAIVRLVVRVRERYWCEVQQHHNDSSSSASSSPLNHDTNANNDEEEEKEDEDDAAAAAAAAAAENTTPKADSVIILAGEWIGQGIQPKPHTAIRSLHPRRFVLCGVRIRGVWQPMERYADIADEEQRLYNISRGGFFHLTLTLTLPNNDDDDDDDDDDKNCGGEDGNAVATAAAAAVAEAGAAFLAEARALTAQVHARCPFGAALGIEGPGEGIVWNPAPGQGVPNVPGFWIKTKGESFAERPQKDPRQKKVLGKEDGETHEFVHRACHERRLEQGWDYLREMHVERSARGMPAFLAWVLRDVEEEEEIAELGLGTGWKIVATRTAREWYLRQLRGDGDKSSVA